MSQTNKYFDLARSEAIKGNCKKRNYGCVIVNPKGQVINFGHTYSITPCEKCKRRFARKGHDYDKCTSLHAEQMCVSGVYVPYGSTAYLACFDAKAFEEVLDPRPCPTCSRLLKQAGVTQVVTPTEVIAL